MSHAPYSDFDPREDERADRLADAREAEPRRRTGCACFAPGEASGTCPGQENCPMACDEHEDAAAAEDTSDGDES